MTRGGMMLPPELDSVRDMVNAPGPTNDDAKGRPMMALAGKLRPRRATKRSRPGYGLAVPPGPWVRR